jgi:hypothetical protein
MMVPPAIRHVPSITHSTIAQERKNVRTVSPTAPGKRFQQLHDATLPLNLTEKIIPDSPAVTRTNPVVIPPRQTSHKRLVTANTGRSEKRTSSAAHPSLATGGGVPTSVTALLEVTTIPVPRKGWWVRSSRRLPAGSNVEDFSKLLLEGVEKREYHGAAANDPVKSWLDVLLSPPDESENEKCGLDDGGTDTPLSVGSLSADSIPSLENDDGVFTPFSEPVTPVPSRPRTWERKQRVISPSENCGSDHPLLPTSYNLDVPIQPETPAPPAVSPISPAPHRPFPRLGSTFKSNLTASLRALKSAAQTVSNFTSPSVRQDDFLTRSFFSFSPELTDDRRPLPTDEPPSPALRRYLNPIIASPAEIHVYTESPRDGFGKVCSCTSSIQLQTYCSSAAVEKRGGDGVGISNQSLPEVLPIRRPREPRENSDFLRMIVLEMNMRRSGKLRHDIPTRARVWLPPRKTDRPSLPSAGARRGRKIPERWVALSLEE